MKRGFLISIMWLVCCSLWAQTNPYLEGYSKFRNKIKNDYENFRDEANRRYTELLRGKWKSHALEKPLKEPKDEERPPVLLKDGEKIEPVKSEPIKIDGEIKLPKLEEQPQPLDVILPDNSIKDSLSNISESEESKLKEQRISFRFFGTPMQVRFNEAQKIKMDRCTSDAVAECWEKMTKKNYDNTLYDCLELRKKHQMSDWAYLLMLDSVSTACTGKGNEATLIMSYLYQQSGYQLRMGIAGGKLQLVFATDHTLFGRPFLRLGNTKFYTYDDKCNLSEMEICDASFPKEKELSLWIRQPLLLSFKASPTRNLTAEHFPEMKVKSNVNMNIVDFYNHYPPSMVNGNQLTRWAMLAQTPFISEANKPLLNALRSYISGQSNLDAVQRLLNWVQTAFVYKYDEDVWGVDRAFFPEETLYHPFCDCEDRSILLTRLIRDLVGLKCVLVYYPGHLACAVCFDKEEVEGDYLVLNNSKFIICDPTYIGAGVGMTMPDMDNASAKVILLE